MHPLLEKILSDTLLTTLKNYGFLRGNKKCKTPDMAFSDLLDSHTKQYKDFQYNLNRLPPAALLDPRGWGLVILDLQQSLANLSNLSDLLVLHLEERWIHRTVLNNLGEPKA